MRQYQEEYVFTSDPNVSTLLDVRIWSHGLYTGWDQDHFEVETFSEWSVKMLDKTMKIVELFGKGLICCSHKTEQIGAFGLFVSGDVKLASKTDVCSKICSEGRRVLERRPNLVTEDEVNQKGAHGHMEVILVPKTIKGVWVKADAREEVIAFAKRVAIVMDVVCFITK